MNTARLRVGPPCTRDQRSAASLDTVRHEQRSSEKRGHIYPTGSLTKGGHEAHRFPCCSARYCRPPSKPQRTRGAPHGAAPPTPPGIRVAYHGGSTGLSRSRNIESGETEWVVA